MTQLNKLNTSPRKRSYKQRPESILKRLEKKNIEFADGLEALKEANDRQSQENEELKAENEELKKGGDIDPAELDRALQIIALLQPTKLQPTKRRTGSKKRSGKGKTRNIKSKAQVEVEAEVEAEVEVELGPEAELGPELGPEAEAELGPDPGSEDEVLTDDEDKEIPSNVFNGVHHNRKRGREKGSESDNYMSDEGF